MNRPVEFRFWHLDRQKMYLVDNFSRDGSLVWWPVPDADIDKWGSVCDDMFSLSDGVLMQFTGIYDRNGAKVWEGDIIYDTYDDEKVEGGLLHSYELVIFAYGSFGLVNNDIHDLDSLSG